MSHVEYEYDKVIPCYFAVSNYCNIRCSYCYVPELHKSQKDELDSVALDRAKKMVQKAKDEKFAFSRVVLHGAEPTTLSPETFGKVIRILSEASIDGQVSVQTNGVGLTKRYLTAMGDLRDTLIIGVTLDLPKQAHDEHRQGTFDKVLKNLQIVKRFGYRRKILVGVSSETVNHLEDVGRTIGWIHENMPDCRIAMKHIKGEGGMDEGQKLHWADFLLKYNLYDYDHTFWGNLCQVKGNDCFWFEFMMDGGVVSCNKVFGQDHVFANWLEESMEEVIRKRKTVYQDYLVAPECVECEWKSVCNSSCPVDRDERGLALDCAIRKKVLSKLKEEGKDPFKVVQSTPVHFRQKEFMKWKKYGLRMGWVQPR